MKYLVNAFYLIVKGLLFPCRILFVKKYCVLHCLQVSGVQILVFNQIISLLTFLHRSHRQF